MYKSGRVAIANVVPDPGQPRKLFQPGELTSLSENLKKIGQQVAVIVYQDGDKFVLLDGERRFRAAKLAGLSELSAVMLPERPSKAQLRVLQNSLDAHREQLTPMERSNLIAEIQQETGWTVNELVEQLSMNQSQCSRFLAYQKLDPELQAALHTGALDTDRAQLLSQLDNRTEQVELFKCSTDLSRDQFRAKLKAVKGDGKPKPTARRSVFFTASGMTITVNGRESDLDGVIGGLTEVLKELKRGLAQGLDITTAARVLRDKAKRGDA